MTDRLEQAARELCYRRADRCNLKDDCENKHRCMAEIPSYKDDAAAILELVSAWIKDAVIPSSAWRQFRADFGLDVTTPPASAPPRR